jgi:hypothetical protein
MERMAATSLVEVTALGSPCGLCSLAAGSIEMPCQDSPSGPPRSVNGSKGNTVPNNFHQTISPHTRIARQLCIMARKIMPGRVQLNSRLVHGSVSLRFRTQTFISTARSPKAREVNTRESPSCPAPSDKTARHKRNHRSIEGEISQTAVFADFLTACSERS